jgi:DNA primase
VDVCRRIAVFGQRHRDRDGRVQVRALLDDAMADPQCAPVATELSMADRHFDDLAAHAQDCLGALQRKRHERLMSELIAKLRDAERDGRADEVNALNAEVNALRLQKAAVSSAGPV